MKKVMLVSATVDALIEERYRQSLENDPELVIWDTFEVDPELLQRYEDLRIELYELVEEIREEAKK